MISGCAGRPGKLGVAIFGLVAMAGLSACGVDVENQQVVTGNTLCQNKFETCVNPIFNLNIRRSNLDIIQCASGGCHEVGAGFGGSFKIYANAATPAELQANYVVSLAFANLTRSADSKLLLEPLAGTSSITGSHTGGDIFPNTADQCYLAIQDWINTVVDDQSSPLCVPCAAPPAACGY